VYVCVYVRVCMCVCVCVRECVCVCACVYVRARLLDFFCVHFDTLKSVCLQSLVSFRKQVTADILPVTCIIVTISWDNFCFEKRVRLVELVARYKMGSKEIFKSYR